MNQYWEQDTPSGRYGVEIEWSPQHQHYHCFVWLNPSSFASLVYANTDETLQQHLRKAKNLGIKIPEKVIVALLDDQGRTYDNYQILRLSRL